MTQRLVFFFTKKNSKNLTFYDSQTWTFFSKYFPKKRLEELIPFFIVTLKIFFLKYEYDSQNWFCFQYDSQNWTCFFENDFFFLTLNFFLNTTRRIEILQYDSEDSTFFSDMTHRIDPFFRVTLWIELIFKKYDLPHRIEPLFMNLFSRWQKELNSFFLTQRIEPFLFSNVTQRIEILQYDSEDSTFFFLWYDSKYWTFFVWLSELIFFQEIWLDSSNGTSFYEPLFKMTQRVEVFLSVSQNWTFFFLKKCSKNWNLFSQNVS